MFYRFGPETSACTFVLGNLIRVRWFTNVKAPKGEELGDFYSGGVEEGAISILKDPVDIYVSIIESLKKSCALAIQDDIYAHDEHDRINSYAKLMLIDKTDYSTQPIFFDDNAIPYA